MPHPTGPTDENLRKIIVKLRKTKDRQMMDIAKHLKKSRRRKRAVNISRLEKLSRKQATFIVPGKVLGIGEIRKSINVYAWTFSKTAKQKIQNAGGHALSLDDLLKDKPKARTVL
jgi:large subunit ribosomal protein L18e